MVQFAPRIEIEAAVAASGFTLDVPVDKLVCEQIYRNPIASATAGIWRVTHGDWSAVLKVLRLGGTASPAWQAGTDETHWYYWKREALAYASGLLARLVPPLRAPRCFGVFEREDGSVGVWLEDLGPAAGTAAWSIGDYRIAAAALGVAQGTIAVSRQFPDAPWLARKWLRRYVERRAPLMAQLDASETWTLPLVAHYLQPAWAEEIRSIWDRHEELLDIVEAAPQTLCHLDLHPANLFALEDDIVLTDWAFVGIGAVGEDPANLIFDAVFDFFVTPDDIIELGNAITTGYLDGLSQAGWAGDPEQVRQTMQAAAIKYCWIVPAMLDAAASHCDTLNRRPIEEGFARWAAVIPELIRFANSR
jgi:hypothetical protein